MSGRPGWIQLALCGVPFLLLWILLVNNLRVEWSLNPQYSYGFIMPILCLGLLYNRWRSVQDSGVPLADAGPASRLPVWAALTFIVLLAIYLPTRLIQEATPEWRMVSWSLGLITVGLTLVGVILAFGMGWFRQVAFAILFFLVAIPWPSFIEGRVIQELTRANATLVIEVLTVMGIPALQHGNVIEIATGTVGVEEACSGIRSFQSSLMVSLFLGEFFRLGLWKRLVLVPIGFLVAFGFNICRTTLLTYVAATDGVEAINDYHDPAGFAILIASSLVLWLLAWLFSRGNPEPAPVQSPLPAGTPISPGDLPSLSAALELGDGVPANEERPMATAAANEPASSVNRPSPSPATASPTSPSPLLIRYATILIVWLAVVEIGVALWYLSRESRVTTGPSWSVAFPTNHPSYKEIPMHPTTASLLRFDEGQQGSWDEADGTRWMGFSFEWHPGRVAGYLAKRHTPEVCLPASGARLLEGPELMPLTVHGIELPMRHYVFESQGKVLQVFQCRWEAGAAPGAHVLNDSDPFNLVRGIWAGRGKHGQKVLEFIIFDARDAQHAKEILVQQLDRLLVVHD